MNTLIGKSEIRTVKKVIIEWKIYLFIIYGPSFYLQFIFDSDFAHF